MSLLGPKRWLDDWLGPSTLGFSDDDCQRPKGRFRVKQLVDICFVPTVGIGIVIHTPADIQIFLTAYSEKAHKKTATIKAEAPTMTVGKVAL